MAANNFSRVDGISHFDSTTFLHTDTGYKYQKAKARANGTIYLRCCLRKSCPATAIIKQVSKCEVLLCWCA